MRAHGSACAHAAAKEGEDHQWWNGGGFGGHAEAAAKPLHPPSRCSAFSGRARTHKKHQIRKNKNPQRLSHAHAGLCMRVLGFLQPHAIGHHLSCRHATAQFRCCTFTVKVTRSCAVERWCCCQEAPEPRAAGRKGFIHHCVENETQMLLRLKNRSRPGQTGIRWLLL